MKLIKRKMIKDIFSTLSSKNAQDGVIAILRPLIRPEVATQNEKLKSVLQEKTENFKDKFSFTVTGMILTKIRNFVNLLKNMLKLSGFLLKLNLQ